MGKSLKQSTSLRSQQLTETQYLITIWLLLISVSLMVGVNQIDSLVLSSVATLNFQAGIQIVRWAKPNTFSGSSRLPRYSTGLGMAVGTVAPAFLGVLVQILNISYLNPHVVFPFCVLLLCTITKYRNTGLNVQSINSSTLPPTTVDLDGIYIVLIGTLLVLAGWSWRLLFVVAGVVVAWWAWRRCGVTNGLSAVLFFGAIALGGAFLIRGITDRFISSDWIGLDVLWDEAQGSAVSRSLFADALYFGREHHIYFLANHWSGTLAELAGSKPLVVSGQFGIVLGVFAVVVNVFDGASNLFESRAAGFASVLFLTAQISFPNEFEMVTAIRVPNLLPLAWLLAAVSLTTSLNVAPAWSNTAIIAVLIGGVSIGKLPYVGTYLLFLIVFACVTHRATESRTRATLFAISAYSLLVVIIVASWMGEHSGSTKLSFTPADLPMLLGLFLLRGLGLQISESNLPFQRVRLLLLLGVVFGPSVITNQSDYLVRSAGLAINAVLVSNALVDSYCKLRRKRFLFIPLIAGFTLSLVYWVTHIHSIRTAGLLHRLLYQRELVLWFGLTIALLVLGWIYSRNWRGGAVIVAVSGLGLYVGHTFQQPVERALYGVGSDYSILYDHDRLEVGEFLREKTEETAVIASNSVCRTRVADGDMTPTGEVGCQANLDAWLSALSRRQTYFEAPYWSSAGLILDEEEADRYGLVVRFGQVGALEDARRLADLGVDYFVEDVGDSPNMGCKGLNADVEIGRYRIYNLMRLKEVVACTTEDET